MRTQWEGCDQSGWGEAAILGSLRMRRVAGWARTGCRVIGRDGATGRRRRRRGSPHLPSAETRNLRMLRKVRKALDFIYSVSLLEKIKIFHMF